jgi:hypothetical protein
MEDVKLDNSPLKDWVPTEVHNWEGKETNVLVLNYTMACPLACDFCCYACHSGRTSQTMPLEKAISLVQQGAQLDVFSSIAFTGGEPLLFLNEIIKVSSVAQGFGLPITLATACHWASTPSAARGVINRLADVGLHRLNVSHDPSHAKFVPSTNVVNAVHAAVEREIPTYVVGTFYSASETLTNLVPELEGLPKVKLVNKFVGKVGRAKKANITQASYGLALALEDLCCYRRVYHDLVVFWDGKAYPCCSTFNRATPGISIGNAFDEGLRTLWSRTEGSLLLRTMKRQGFAELYKVIREMDEELYQQLPPVGQAVGPCSLCNGIFGRKELSARVKSAFEPVERAKVAHAVNVVKELIGEEKLISFLEPLERQSFEGKGDRRAEGVVQGNSGSLPIVSITEGSSHVRRPSGDEGQPGGKSCG